KGRGRNDDVAQALVGADELAHHRAHHGQRDGHFHAAEEKRQRHGKAHLEKRPQRRRIRVQKNQVRFAPGLDAPQLIGVAQAAGAAGGSHAPHLRAPGQRSGWWGWRTLLSMAAKCMASNLFWLSELMEPSVPRAAPVPWSSHSRTGAMPLPSFRLLAGLCTAVAPASPMRRMSPSVSQIAW